ncbi:MAG: putative porin [Bacteroidia bacterium]
MKNDAHAQFNGPPAGVGGIGDTIQQDSLALFINSEIKENTIRVSPEAIFNYQNELADSVTADQRRRPFFMPTDTLTGFSQTLGFTGKPILRWLDGREARDAPGPFYRDPFFRQIDYYLYPNTRPDYYDTHTPYLNLDYQIGPRNYQMINGVFSRNIGDQWNLAGRYAARSGNAPYADFATTNRSINFNSYYRGPGRRYHAFAEVALRDNRDFINGGLPIALGDTTPSQSLRKQASDLFLAGAERQRLLRTIHIDQHYRLIGFGTKNDSLPDTLKSPISQRQINLRLTANLQSQRFGFGDPAVTADSVWQFLQTTPYPWIDTAATTLQDTIRSFVSHIEGAISYREGKNLLLQGGLGQKLITHRNDSLSLTDSRPIFWVRGTFNTPKLRIQGETRREGSTLFAAETFLGGNIRVRPFATAGKPGRLQISGAASVAGLNPSMYQRYYIPDTSQSYVANGELVNEGVIKAHGEIRLQEKSPNDSAVSNFIALRAFLSTTSRPLYYDTEMRPLQGDSSASLTWLGLRLSGRVRVTNFAYFEGEANVQAGSSSGPAALEAYTQQVPDLYGRIGLYVEDRQTAYGSIRVGGEIRGFSRYNAFSVDAFSGEFYPSNVRLEPYARLDLSAEINFTNVLLWFRMQHVNELLVVPGYFTTPYYPEQERMFVAGISWTFFD